MRRRSRCFQKVAEEFKSQVLPKEFSPHTSIKHPHHDHLPTTIEGCIQELERIGETQKRYAQEMDLMADRQRAVTSRMRQIGHSPHSSNSAEIKQTQKVELTPNQARNVSMQLTKVFPSDSVLVMSAEEEDKNWDTPISGAKDFSEFRSSELGSVGGNLERGDSNFH